MRKAFFGKNISYLFLLAFIAFPAALLADPDGADPRLTGAPGDNAQACTACHTGTKLNGGAGSVKIVLPGGNTYSPGVKQRVSVQVSDPAQRRWGFELTARLASNLSNGQAGDLTPADGYTQVRCDNGRPKPCSATSPVQFITHTLSGTRPGTTGGVSFDFDWTPPASDSGDIVLYAAANAANANNNDTGDHIYTSSLRLTPAAVSAKPAIGAAGVVNAASFQPGIAPSSWLTIAGSNLASTTRAWNSDDLAAGNLPLSLDGVSVTINGKPAYVEYVSPSQINVVTPSDAAAGTVEVKVTASGQTSDPAYAELQAFAPAFFSFDGKYLAATHADNTLLGKPGLFPSAPNLTTPAKPGETVILYGTGFGPTSPSIADGRLTDQIASITAPLTITIGGVPASVSFAGLVPPFAALYQFNVVVPETLPDGDQAVSAQVGGVDSRTSQGCCYLTIQR